MTNYTIKKSDLLIEGYFRRPAFALLHPGSKLHSTVTNHLWDFHHIQGDDISINQDSNPLANVHVTYNLRPFSGIARVSIDQSRLVFFDPHLLNVSTIADLSLAFLNAVHKEIGENSYSYFLVKIGFHAQLQGMDPATYTAQYATPVSDGFGPIAGNAVTYYLGRETPRDHSSISLDMSGEFSQCVFVHIAIRCNGEKISVGELPDAIIEHCNHLISLVGLEPK